MNDRADERREHQRFPVVLPIVSLHGDTEIEMRTANISLGGAYCHVNHYIPEMTKLALRIRIDSRSVKRPDWLEAEAIVVRIEPNRRGADDYHVAMFFTNMKPETREKLRNMLS